MKSRISRPTLGGLLALLASAFLGVTTENAWAQAWVAPEGTGTISVTHQRLFNTGHRRIGGFVGKIGGQSTDAAIYLDGEYAISDRFSVSAGVPFIFARYTGVNPPPDPIKFFAWDKCRCWQSGLQDFHF